jgi:hypothetical protein
LNNADSVTLRVSQTAKRYTSVIPKLGRLRQADLKFRVSTGIEHLISKKQTNQKKKPTEKKLKKIFSI